MISKKIISRLTEMTQNTLVIFTFQVCLGTLTIHGRNTRTIVIQFKVFRHTMLLSSHPYSSKPFYHLIALSTNYSVTHASYFLGARLRIHCPQAGLSYCLEANGGGWRASHHHSPLNISSDL